MLTFLEEFPDHISSLFRSSKNIIIVGDFNIPWNKQEHPDTTSMHEILDMHDLHQHIHTQTHKLGNTLDWLISNSPDIIQDITNKDFLSDHSIIEWKFQISRKVSQKIHISRRDLTKTNEESFNRDLKKNLEIDIEKTLQQNYNNYMDAIKKTIDKHAPMKTKTKKTTTPGSTRIHKSSKLNEGWLRKDGSHLKNIRTS